MKYLLSVVENSENPEHSSAERAAIDQINLVMQEAGYRVFAGGMKHPKEGKVFDFRTGSAVSNPGSTLFKNADAGADFQSGFWIIEVPSEEIAEDLAQRASAACNRKIELRQIFG